MDDMVWIEFAKIVYIQDVNVVILDDIISMEEVYNKNSLEDILLLFNKECIWMIEG